MNELALITWVCSAPRAAVSHWWQLCFALASFNGQQAAEGACSGSLFQGGLIRRPWKRMGTGVKGWQVGGCGWGQHAIPAFSLGDPLHTPSPYPRQLHAIQLLPALWHPGPCDVGARRSRRFGDKNIPTRAFTGCRRKAAALGSTFGFIFGKVPNNELS